jgi:hypothetical protein
MMHMHPTPNLINVLKSLLMVGGGGGGGASAILANAMLIKSSLMAFFIGLKLLKVLTHITI